MINLLLRKRGEGIQNEYVVSTRNLNVEVAPHTKTLFEINHELE